MGDAFSRLSGLPNPFKLVLLTLAGVSNGVVSKLTELFRFIGVDITFLGVVGVIEPV